MTKRYPPRIPAAFLLLFIVLSSVGLAQQKLPAGWKATTQPVTPVISPLSLPGNSTPSTDAIEIKPVEALAPPKNSAAKLMLTPLPFTCGRDPIGVADNYAVEKGKTLTIAAPGLLVNDFDPDGGSINVTSVTFPSHGVLTSAVTNGSFAYVPNAGFTGTDQFTYIIRDNDNNVSDPVTVTIQVVELFNRKPIGISDHYATQAGKSLAIAAPGLLTNDLDPDGDVIIVTSVTFPSNGVLTSAVTNGSFTYAPNAGFTGTDAFTYVIRDAQNNLSDPTTVTIDVLPAFNRKPVGVSDQFGTVAGQTLTVAAPGVLRNDLDPDGDVIIVTSVTFPSHGILTSAVTNGSFTYVTNAGFTGTDQFTYIIRDAEGNLSDPATITINVVSAGNLPVGSADTYMTEKNKTLTVSAPGLLANDFDADGGTVIANSVTQPSHGVLTSAVTNGSFTYVPSTDFTGTDQFTYLIRDNDNNLSSPVTVTIWVVEPFNRKPIGIGDHYATSEGKSLSVTAPGLLTNDLDPDGDVIIVTSVTQPTNGMLTSAVTNGSFTYVPNAGFTGTDAFTYVIRDAQNNLSDPTTVTIDVLPAFNRKPIGVSDTYSTLEGQTLAVAAPGVLRNDFDPDGDVIIVTSVTFPTHGILTSAVTNGSFTYVPNAGFVGTDQFSYILRDAEDNLSDPITITVVVVGINQPPVASASNTTVECTSPTGTPVTLDGSASTDREGGMLTYTWFENTNIVAGPTNSSTASAIFTTGAHSVKLKVEDECGESSETTISVKVQDTKPPVVQAALLPAVRPHEFVVSCSSSDVCSPIIATKSIIVLPHLVNPSVSLKNKKQYSLDIDEKKNTVSVQAPNAAAFWAMVVANGGIPVSGGQVIDAKYDRNKYQLIFDDNGNLVSIKGAVVLLRCTATDANGNTGVGEFSLPMDEALAKADPSIADENSSIKSLNYPNPFIGKTTIAFSLAERAFVQIAILDMTGRVVDEISGKQMEVGDHQITWNAKGRAAGVYFYQIRYNGKQVTNKMILLGP